MGIHPAESAHPSVRYTLHFEAQTCNEARGSSNALTGAEAKGERRWPGAAGFRTNPEGIGIGDRVVIQYLDDGKRITVRLTNGRTDIVNGLLDVSSPLGAELVGKTEDDEVEIDLDGRLRRVLIIKVSQMLKSA